MARLVTPRENFIAAVSDIPSDIYIDLNQNHELILDGSVCMESLETVQRAYRRYLNAVKLQEGKGL